MPMSVQDVLDLPVMQSARPEVVAGDDLARRPVRWIHTSEIYEIGPLLKGGEVLLTTGLGLVGMSTEAITGYVRSLAQRKVAALVLELGRTFPQPPPALRETAVQQGLPLVLLHGVVPFVEVTEAAHPLLITEELDQLRLLERASAELNQLLLAGRGLDELVAAVSAVCNVPVGLVDPHGVLLAGSAADPATQVFELPVGAASWLTLVVTAAESPELRRLAELGATAVGICLAQEGRVSPTGRTSAAVLLHDLASGRYLSSSEISRRAGVLGLQVRPGQGVVGIAARTTTLTSV